MPELKNFDLWPVFANAPISLTLLKAIGDKSILFGRTLRRDYGQPAGFGGEDIQQELILTNWLALQNKQLFHIFLAPNARKKVCIILQHRNHVLRCLRDPPSRMRTIIRAFTD